MKPVIDPLRWSTLLLTLWLLGCAGQPGVDDDRDLRAARIYVELGVGYMREGKLELAREKLSRALALAPDLASANSATALLYERLGDLEGAEAYHRKAVAGRGIVAGPRNNYGTFLCRRKRFEEALEQFQQAGTDPLYASPWWAFMNGGSCALQMSDPVRAEKFFLQAVRVNPGYSPALLQLARIEFKKGEFARAGAYLNRYRRVASQTPESLWLGVRIAHALGDRDREASYSLLLKGGFADSPEARLLSEWEKNESGVGK